MIASRMARAGRRLLPQAAASCSRPVVATAARSAARTSWLSVQSGAHLAVAGPPLPARLFCTTTPSTQLPFEDALIVLNHLNLTMEGVIGQHLETIKVCPPLILCASKGVRALVGSRSMARQ